MPTESSVREHLEDALAATILAGQPPHVRRGMARRVVDLIAELVVSQVRAIQAGHTPTEAEIRAAIDSGLGPFETYAEDDA